MVAEQAYLECKIIACRSVQRVPASSAKQDLADLRTVGSSHVAKDQIVAFVSDFTPLSPGDVIATGTPEGVGMGRTPPIYLKPGDVVEVEIEGIGVLRNPVVEEELSPMI